MSLLTYPDAIHLVPDDILYEILLQCCPDPLDLSSNACFSLDISKPPWSISQVSQRWRDILLHTSRAWSMVYLNFSQYTSKQTGGELLALQLSRARQYPLTLRLYVNTYNADALSPCHPFLRVLTPDVLRRTSHLRFNHLPPYLRVRDAFLALTSLHVLSGGVTRVPPDVFGALPALVSLTTDDPRWTVPSPASIRSYSVTCTDSSDIRTALHGMRNLSNLELQFKSGVDMAPCHTTGDSTIDLPHLETLIINDWIGVGAAKTLLSLIHAPRLQILNVAFGPYCRVNLPGEDTMKAVQLCVTSSDNPKWC